MTMTIELDRAVKNLFAPRLASVDAGDYLVATRCAMPTGFNAANTRGTAASAHFFQDSGAYLDFGFPHFAVVIATQTTELSPGGDGAIKAWIEYPLGTFTPILFGGSVTGVLPNGGIVAADRLAITYKLGDMFRIWTDRTCASGLPFSSKSALFLGEKGNLSTSIAALVPGVAIGGSDPSNYYAPVWITGLTRERSLAIIGDSIDFGLNDQVEGDRGAIGVVARSIDASMAYTRLAVSSDRAQYFVASHTQRMLVALKATDVSIGYGSNDLGGSRTQAELEADMVTILGYFPARMKKYTRQIIPRCSATTDNWATTANQTPLASPANFTTLLLAVNAAREALGQGFDACWKTFDALCDGTISGGNKNNKWRCDPAAIAYWFTNDGTHPSKRGNKEVKSAGVVRPIP